MAVGGIFEHPLLRKAQNTHKNTKNQKPKKRHSFSGY
jgi:hypothetical protein